VERQRLKTGKFAPYFFTTTTFAGDPFA